MSHPNHPLVDAIFYFNFESDKLEADLEFINSLMKADRGTTLRYYQDRRGEGRDLVALGSGKRQVVIPVFELAYILQLRHAAYLKQIQKLLGDGSPSSYCRATACSALLFLRAKEVSVSPGALSPALILSFM